MWKSLAAEAAKVAVVAWAVVALDPWLSRFLSVIGDIPRYLISAVVVALILEALLFFVIGRPLIEIWWATAKDRVEVEGRILAKVAARSPVTEQYLVRFSLTTASMAGRAVLNWIFKQSPILVVQLARTNLVPFVENSSQNEGGFPAVRANDRVHGFHVELGRPPLRAGEWHSARVRWEVEGDIVDLDRRFDLVWDAPTRLGRLALRCLVRVNTNVDNLKLIRR